MNFSISPIILEHYEFTEPVYAAIISDTGDSVGKMQVEMTNNVAYKITQFTKFTSVDIHAYALVITEYW